MRPSVNEQQFLISLYFPSQRSAIWASGCRNQNEDEFRINLQLIEKSKAVSGPQLRTCVFDDGLRCPDHQPSDPECGARLALRTYCGSPVVHCDGPALYVSAVEIFDAAQFRMGDCAWRAMGSHCAGDSISAVLCQWTQFVHSGSVSFCAWIPCEFFQPGVCDYIPARTARLGSDSTVSGFARGDRTGSGTGSA